MRWFGWLPGVNTAPAFGLHLKFPVTRIAQVSFNPVENGYQLDRFLSLELPPECVENDSFVQPEAVGSLLRAALAKADFGRRAVVSIPNRKAIIRNLQVPRNVIDGPEDEEIVETVFQHADIQGVALNDLLFDFYVDERGGDDDAISDVMAVAARQEDAYPFIECVEAAGIRVCGVTVDSVALARLFQYALSVMPQESKYLVVSHIAEDRIHLIAFRNGSPLPIYFREQEYALQKQLGRMQERDSEEYARSITESVVNVIERQISMFLSAVPQATSSLETLFLSGIYSRVPDIDSELSRLGLALQWLSVPDLVQVSETIATPDAEQISGAQIAVGLAMIAADSRRLIVS